MIEQKPSTIGEAPSLADIKSAKADRLGRVDFTARLGSTDGTDEAEGTDDGSVVSLTSIAHPARPAAVETDEHGGRLPFILPPAKIDEAMALEAQRVRRAIAETRGELIAAEDAAAAELAAAELAEAEEEAAALAEAAAELAAAQAEADADGGIDDTPEDLADDARDDVSHTDALIDDEPEAEVVVETPAEPARRSFRWRKPEPEPEAVPAAAPTPSVADRLKIQDVASLDELGAEVAARHAAAAAEAEEADRVAAIERAQAEADAAAEARALARLSAAAEVDLAAPVEDLDDLLDEDVTGFDDDLDDVPGFVPGPPAPATTPATTPGSIVTAAVVAGNRVAPDRAVADVADEVIALMRSTQDAHQRHLESVELEAARRCELLTAQAELDAELIRLHARREAHAIVSAARTRAGTATSLPPESDQMSEIGETFSRFAETIETTVAFGPASPDQTRKS